MKGIWDKDKVHTMSFPLYQVVSLSQILFISCSELAELYESCSPNFSLHRGDPERLRIGSNGIWVVAQREFF